MCLTLTYFTYKISTTFTLTISEDFIEVSENPFCQYETRDREKRLKVKVSVQKGTTYLQANMPALKHTFIQGTKTSPLMHLTHGKHSSLILFQIKSTTKNMHLNRWAKYSNHSFSS